VLTTFYARWLLLSPIRSLFRSLLGILPKFKICENSRNIHQIFSEERWNGYSPSPKRGPFWTKLCQKRGTFTPKRWPTPLDWRVPFCRFSVQISEKEGNFELNYAKKGGAFASKRWPTSLDRRVPFCRCFMQIPEKISILNYIIPRKGGNFIMCK
jgi:hypothetical protein